MIKQCGFLNRLPARPRKFTQCNASNYFSRPGMDQLYCTRIKTIHFNTSKQYDTLHSFPIHIIMIIRIVTMTTENWSWVGGICCSSGWQCAVFIACWSNFCAGWNYFCTGWIYFCADWNYFVLFEIIFVLVGIILYLLEFFLNWLELFCAGWICLCWLELFLCCLELFLYWLEIFLCWLEWINLVAMKTPQRCPDCLRPLKHAFYPHHNYICVPIWKLNSHIFW